MAENEVLTELLRLLSGSPSTWVSILLAAVLLKKYVINGTIIKFLDLKEKEVKSLSMLESGLSAVLLEQQKLNELVRFQGRPSDGSS